MGDGKLFLEGDITLMTKDGQEISLPNATINEISVTPETYEHYDPGKNYQHIKLERNNVELSLSVKSISKKRFVKLLMGRGIARNGAKDIASYIHKKYGFYNPTQILFL